MTRSAVLIYLSLLVCSFLLMTFGKRRLIKRAFVKTAHRLLTDAGVTMFCDQILYSTLSKVDENSITMF